MTPSPPERPRNALDALLSAARTEIDQARLDLLQAGVLIALEASGLDAVTCAEIRDGVDQVRALAARMAWYFQPGYSVIEQRRLGKPDALVVRGALMGAIDRLMPYAALIGDTRHRPDGYSASDLKREAEIGNDLWQRLVRLSGLKRTSRGGQHRRFSGAEVRKLAAAADKSGTPKTMEAARRWRALIAEPSSQSGTRGS
jgi:hypothetical protein